MTDKETDKEDLLRQYVNKEKIELAPEGFTAKVMTRVRLETVAQMASERPRKKNLVPVISAAVTILLIASALLIPGNQTDSLANPVLSIFKSIKSFLPDIKISTIFQMNLPSVTIYVFIGILILTLFDRALQGIFHRGR